MDKEERYRQYKKQTYADYPEVERFERRKRRWFRFLLLFSITVSVVRLVYCSRITVAGTGAIVFAGVTGYAPELTILLGTMYPRWRFAFGLALLGGYQVTKIIGGILELVDSWEAFFRFYVEGFWKYPAAICIDAVSLIKALFILGTSVWLVTEKNRELSDQSEILWNKLKVFRLTNSSVEPGKGK